MFQCRTPPRSRRSSRGPRSSVETKDSTNSVGPFHCASNSAIAARKGRCAGPRPRRCRGTRQPSPCPRCRGRTRCQCVSSTPRLDSHQTKSEKRSAVRPACGFHCRSGCSLWNTLGKGRDKHGVCDLRRKAALLIFVKVAENLNATTTTTTTHKIVFCYHDKYTSSHVR